MLVLGWIVSPRKDMLKSYLLVLHNVILFGGWGLCRCCQVNMRSIGWALIWYDWCFYEKGQFECRDISTGIMPWEHEGKDLGHATTSLGWQKLTANHPKLQKRPGTDPWKQSTVPTAWSCSSSLQNCDKVHFCCCKPSILGIFLWQLQEMNTVPNKCSLNEWIWYYTYLALQKCQALFYIL